MSEPVAPPDSAAPEAGAGAPPAAKDAVPPPSRWARLRTWLERNKIFFEIFAAVALGVMGLVLTYQGNRLAESQNDLTGRQTNLTKRQTRIAEEQLRPRLRFELQGNLGDHGTSLTAKNEGGPILTSRIEDLAFLVLALRSLQPPGREEILWIPFDYFPFFSVTGNSQGELYRTFPEFPGVIITPNISLPRPAPNSREKLAAFREKLEKELPGKGLRLEAMVLQQYVEVDYEWTLGREVESFRVQSLSGPGVPTQRFKGKRVVSPNLPVAWKLSNAHALENTESLVKAIPQIRKSVVRPPGSQRLEQLLRSRSWRDRRPSSEP